MCACAARLIKVPLGTVVSLLHQQDGRQHNDDDDADKDTEPGEHAPPEVLADLSAPGASVTVASGGQGGRGNAAFGRRQNRPALRERELGHPGQERALQLELKLLADVGFVGAPNAGKSTLLRALSRARPMVCAYSIQCPGPAGQIHVCMQSSHNPFRRLQVGSYAFTTLEPQLGVVSSEDMRLLVADIPGLVAGASQNRGLGHSFLRHIERTRVVAFVLDLSTGVHGRDGLHPCQQLRMLQVRLQCHDVVMHACVVWGNNASLDSVQDELLTYSADLQRKAALVVANKADLLADDGGEVVAELQSSTQLPVFVISAQVGNGVDAVRQALLEKVECMQEAEGNKLSL
jgi:GTP-binding protein